jgi:GNAT superfamily N-acetyltransferase
MSSQPKRLESAEKLPDGILIGLRSVCPEDERLLQDLAAHMSPEDMRLRFFVGMRGLSHELAAQLSHIDCDRDLALLAFAVGGENVLGVARFSADTDHRASEFAIAVRSDWKGRGLGHLLMARLIYLAWQRGINKLVGQVLPENAAMLQLCREFGFTITLDPRDPKLRLASKTLDLTQPSERRPLGGNERSTTCRARAPLRTGLAMPDRLRESRLPTARDVVGAWLLCALIAAFALGLSAALRPAPPRFSSPMTAGVQTAPRSWSTSPLSAASRSSSTAAPSFTPIHRS